MIVLQCVLVHNHAIYCCTLCAIRLPPSLNSRDLTIRAKIMRSLLFFYYIFHIKPHFFKTLFQSQFLFDFDDIFTNKGRIKI